jgi:hypothetical protein
MKGMDASFVVIAAGGQWDPGTPAGGNGLLLPDRLYTNNESA